MGEDIAERIKREYSFGKLDEQSAMQADSLRGKFGELAWDLLAICPDNRARSLALTNLQQAKMWAVQAVVDAAGTG